MNTGILLCRRAKDEEFDDELQNENFVGGMMDSGSFDFERQEFRTLYAPFERYLSC